MSQLRIPLFGGLRPSASELRLADSEAVEAQDVFLRRGLLMPRPRQLVWDGNFPDPAVPVLEGQIPQTLYRFRRYSDLYGDYDYWMYWTTDVDVVAGPVANVTDSDERHYYTGDPAGTGAPKMFTADSVEAIGPHDTLHETSQSADDPKYPRRWFYVGVPAPEDPPQLDLSGVTLPTDALGAGTITNILTPTILAVRHGDTAPGQSSSSINNDMTSATGITAYTGGVNPSGQTIGPPDNNGYGFVPGMQFKVQSIVDENNVIVTGIAGATDLGTIAIARGYQWSDSSFGVDLDIQHHLTYDDNLPTNFGYFWTSWDLPSGCQFTVPAHELQVNDIIQISAVNVALTATLPTQFDCESGPSPKTCTPHDSVHGSLHSSDTIDFVGQLAYLIQRSGQLIDPTIGAGGSSTAQDITTETTSYVYTYVTALGEESAPSPPTPLATFTPGNTIGVSGFSDPPTDHTAITNINLYRAATGNSNTGFLLVAQLDITTTSFDDNIPDSDLGDPLPSASWDPPDPRMIGINSHPCGCLVGFWDNVVAFSEVGFGHAYPVAYRKYFDYQVVGIARLGGTIIVLTTGYPYVISGSDPSQMTVRKVPIREPCVDKRSIVEAGNVVLYASPNGLIQISPNGGVNLTKLFYTQLDWAEVVGPPPASLVNVRAWFANQMYILHATYTLEDVPYESKLVFDLASDAPIITGYPSDVLSAGAPVITEFSDDIVAGFYDPGEGQFYYIPQTNPTIVGTLPETYRPILRWNYFAPNADPTVDYVTGIWHSKTFDYKGSLAPAACRVLCRRVTVNGSYQNYANVTVSVYGIRYGIWNDVYEELSDEETLVANAVVINGVPGQGGWNGEVRSAPFRIPTNALFDAVRIECSISGAAEVEAIYIGESMAELEDA